MAPPANSLTSTLKGPVGTFAGSGMTARNTVGVRNVTASPALRVKPVLALQPHEGGAERVVAHGVAEVGSDALGQQEVVEAESAGAAAYRHWRSALTGRLLSTAR